MGDSETRSMLVVFLDIDGVLNKTGVPAGWSPPRPPLRGRTPPSRTKPPRTKVRTQCYVDPEPVRLLNDLTSRACADVVVTSSWVERLGASGVIDMLRSRGVARLHSTTTPTLATRGQRIHAWLTSRSDVRAYVILDDGPPSDFGMLAPRHVRTDGHAGLSSSDVARALRLLTP